MLGMSKSHIRRNVEAKRLRAAKLPEAGGRRRNRWRIARQHLVDWLIAAGFPIHDLRARLNADGILILVNLEPDLARPIGRTFRAKVVSSLFQLGLEIGAQRCWGVLIDLGAEGTQQTCRSVREFAARIDRPELVALHGDEGINDPDPPFDLVLPRSIGTEKLVRALQRMRGSDV